MKVRVSMPEASVSIDFEEEKALEVFRKLNEVLLNIKGKGKPKTEDAVINVKAVVSPEVEILSREKVIEPKYPEPIVEKEQEESLMNLPKYKGFMYIKCPECGKIKGFAMKKESDHYHCDSCGARTEFDKPLVPLWVNCECGKRFKYLTNMTEDMFDINCLDCGAPVAVKWNENKQAYETIK